MRFQGKTVLITGSGTGIGLAIAKKFAENGAGVIILGRRKEPLEAASSTLEGIIKERGTGASVRMFSGIDVSEEAGVNGMFDALEKDGTIVDYIINNAGVSGPVMCFANAPIKEFKDTVGIHLTGTFWCSARGLKVMSKGGKIITISTFFTEERPLEQRPYRFRGPYTASQGAKNRLAEAMSWELAERGIISIATNPGPVHSDRIYKTVYPKAAAEFMRVAGFEGMSPEQVDAANQDLLPLLGEDEGVVKDGIGKAAQKHGDADTLARLLEKIQTIAEKVQKNTSHMIANKEFLSQGQVAESVLNLCSDEMAAILNGKVIPGDRVFYPVRPHVGTTVPGVHQPDFGGRAVIFAVDATDMRDARRVEFLAEHVQKNGGKAACFVSKDVTPEIQEYVSSKCHSHVMNLGDPEEVGRWLGTASEKVGKIAAIVHMTGSVPDSRLTDLTREKWDRMVEKFVTNPAVVAQRALEQFVPGGGRDPRLYKDAAGAVMIIGPDLPAGKTTGEQRARVEVFRGALRPFVTTINQELSDVLKSRARVFAVLPGTVTGAEPDDRRIADALNYMITDGAASSAIVTFCTDESRN